MDDSAMFVDRITLRFPGGGLVKMERCISADKVTEECKVMARRLDVSIPPTTSFRTSKNLLISAKPGKKTRTEPKKK